MNKRIYLDYNATTPCDPRVVEEMLPWFYEKPGNAASRNHPYGWEAEEAVKAAREQIADLLSGNTAGTAVMPREIVFTSGATEANNLALKGIFELYKTKGQHIITVQTEHKAVLDACEKLEKLGGEVTYLPVREDGRIDLTTLENAIRTDTILVSVMWANNETGVIQDMKAIGELCAKNNVLFMSDATQAVGKIPTHPKELGIHLMAFTAHKMYGPKGVGALFVNSRKPRVKLAAQMHGGGHERSRRSGTLNVPGIVGFGKAAAIAKAEMSKEATRLSILRDQLEAGLLNRIEATSVNGDTDHRMSHVTNIAFHHVDAEGLMMTFNQNIALSSGSACTSASLDPSHVLVALGLDGDKAKASLRFSLGKFTEAADIPIVIDQVVKGVEQLRAISPVWEMFKNV